MPPISPATVAEAVTAKGLPTSYAIIGNGWRSTVFLRMVYLFPERLRVTGVRTRRAESGEKIQRDWGVSTFRTLDELLAAERSPRPTFIHREVTLVPEVPMFTDRTDAGRQLAKCLDHLRGRELIVLGLPRGGVPVAAEVAAALAAPLDVLVIRKLGAPSNPEYAIGAIGEGDVRILDSTASARISSDALQAVEDRERIELARRSERYRAGKDPLDLSGKTAVIVDDGIATGSTARAACQVARRLGAASVVLAVPVAPPEWIDRLGADADELVAVSTPSPFFAVGQFYRSFPQTTDEEVLASLGRTAGR